MMSERSLKRKNSLVVYWWCQCLFLYRSKSLSKADENNQEKEVEKMDTQSSETPVGT